MFKQWQVCLWSSLCFHSSESQAGSQSLAASFVLLNLHFLTKYQVPHRFMSLCTYGILQGSFVKFDLENVRQEEKRKWSRKWITCEMQMDDIMGA